MSILWFIIKIILFILLGIIILLLIMLGAILLAPVRYEAYFAKYEEMAYDVKFSYLIGVRGLFYLQDHVKKHRVSAFGKVLYEEKEQEITKDKEAEETGISKSADLNKEDNRKNIRQDIKQEKIVKKADDSVIYKKEKEDKWVKDAEEEVEKSGAEEKLEEAKKKAGRSLKRNKKHYLTSRYTYEAVKHILIAVWDLLKIIAPYEWDFEVVVGTGDPADTGELVAKLIMLYPLYYQHGIVRGDYEKQCFMGGFLMKGRFNLLQVLIRLVRLYLQKDVNAFIHSIKNKGR